MGGGQAIGLDGGYMHTPLQQRLQHPWGPRQLRGWGSAAGVEQCPWHRRLLGGRGQN